MSAMSIPTPQRRRRPRDTFALRLVAIRHELGMTQEEIADLVGVKRPSWAVWEKGRIPREQARVALSIADKTGYDLRWLLYGGPVSDSPTDDDHPTGRLGVRITPQEQRARRIRPRKFFAGPPFRVIQPAA